MLVDGLLRASAARYPQRQALVCGSRRLTYADLDAAVDRVAAGLSGLGVGRGDRVAVYLENSVEAVLAMIGALRAGAVFVPINPTTKAEKLAYVLRDCEPRVLVADARADQVIGDALGEVPAKPTVVLIGASDGVQMALAARTGVEAVVPFEHVAAAAACAIERRIDLDLAALIYTSGSTGRPKGVMLTHLNIVAATTSINSYLKHTSSDVILDVLPLSFDYGLYQLFLAFQSGASVVLERTFVYPALMLELIARERVTVLPIVPMMAALLLRHDLSEFDLSTLRAITNTGAALPAGHIASLRERLPDTRIFSMYGLTECKRVSFLDPDELDRRPTSVGKAMDNVEVFLVDSEGTRIDRGIGELYVRGSNVMQGYWRAPEETARALQPGLLPGERVLRSGDIFRIDEDGFMYFQYRLDDVIKSRGQKVSPREIENVLHDAPGVIEALVIGVADSVLGEAVHAFVTIDPGVAVSEQELLRYCTRRLEDFMVPREIEIVAELPHTSTGKLSRRRMAVSAGQ